MPLNFEQEVVDLHQFFQDWFTGKLPNEDEIATRFSGVLAGDFHIVGPDGQIAGREAIITAVNQGYGAQENMKIWIENTVLHQRYGDLLIVTYEEWQTIGGETTARTSTVLFREDVAAPNGLIWLHVHESGLKFLE